MYLEYSPGSSLIVSPHAAFAVAAYVHVFAAAKNGLFSYTK